MTPGRPGVEVFCRNTCTRIAADVDAARAAAMLDPDATEPPASPAGDLGPPPTGG
ncbi:hypothetical protein BH23ACT9_BH23ACT9_28050 [soil metagenome]